MGYKFPGPGPGRPKGCKNKATQAKEDYFWVFNKLGGKRALFKELLENKRLRVDFMLKVIPSLMPKNGYDSEEVKRIVYDLTPEMESLMRAMLEARRRIGTSDQRADDRAEYQS